MPTWLPRLLGTKPRELHPPWRKGQYVTYFLEREDGSWVAIAMKLIGQTDDNAWIIQADFKSPNVENAVFFRCDPRASADEPMTYLTPVRADTVRGSPDGLFDTPMSHATLAMNLLTPRQWPQVEKALRGPRAVQFPCEIDEVRTLVSPAGGYEKHHDLHPRVMLTGVARMTADGVKNPMIATSFGTAEEGVASTSTYDDFVDLSYPKLTDHGIFQVEYPATWFLRTQQEEGGEQEANLAAMAGGNACSAGLSVRIRSGTKRHVAEEREQILAKLRGGLDMPGGRLVLRKGEPHPLAGDASSFVFDLESPGIQGLCYIGVYLHEAPDLVAELTVFGNILEENPRARRVLNQMGPVFARILHSFRFSAAAVPSATSG